MIIKACITGRSFALTLSNTNFPIPFHENIDSIVKLPASRNPRLLPISVTLGRMAFFNPCFIIAMFSESPFARAVFM